MLALPAASLMASPKGWWDKAWTKRQEVVISPQAGNPKIDGSIAPGATLVRLHVGNFSFSEAHPEGADLRIIGADGAEVKHHLEKYDSLFGEAFVWMASPADGAVAPMQWWLYYGAASAQSTADLTGTYGDQALAVYHFGETSGAPKDFSGKGNHAAKPAIPVEGSLIGTGARLQESGGIEIPGSETLKWLQGAEFTWSMWIKPADVTGERTLMHYGGADSEFRVGLAEGVPFIEVAKGGAPERVAGEKPLAGSAWQHIAAVSGADGVAIYVGGVQAVRLNSAVPALAGALTVGKRDGEDKLGFAGEIDEMQIWKVARPAGALLFDAQSQGATEQAAQLVAVSETEGGGGHSKMLEHLSLFGDIAHNMMFDGWIAISICILMVCTGWTVAIQKFNYLSSIQKGSDTFMKLWHKVGTDLTVLEEKDEHGEPIFWKKLNAKDRFQLKRSPLYHLYQIGTGEIEHRIGHDRALGLSARSIQAIKASLDTGIVHENTRMHKGLVFLTISIAGGPYVGLLGTVVGVMITFALIARSGEVEVNSIAPGIASALLATVAGLVVAIPALFIYSYLSSRIKELLASMQVFVDEFIAKMAEFYPTPGENGPNPAGRPNGNAESKPAAADSSARVTPASQPALAAP